MRERHEALPSLTYMISDVTHMPEFSDCYFGSVLDKGAAAEGEGIAERGRGC